MPVGRGTYDFLREPTGETYQRLLAVGARYCSLALLVAPQSPMSASCSALVARVSPYLIATEQTSKWPGTELLSDVATVWTYRFSEELAALFSAVASGLYEWHGPGLPEDLALLRGPADVWLGSVAHESDAWLELTEAERSDIAHEVAGIDAILGPARAGRRSLPDTSE
jgi:hypothetical protein